MQNNYNSLLNSQTTVTSNQIEGNNITELSTRKDLYVQFQLLQNYINKMTRLPLQIIQKENIIVITSNYWGVKGFITLYKKSQLRRKIEETTG